MGPGDPRSSIVGASCALGKPWSGREAFIGHCDAFEERFVGAKRPRDGGGGTDHVVITAPSSLPIGTTRNLMWCTATAGEGWAGLHGILRIPRPGRHVPPRTWRQ